MAQGRLCVKYIITARARIRELEEGSEWLTARGSQQKDRKANSARNEIIALSVRYGLISRETSFVAVERRETPVVGDVNLRKVPIALTSGWGGSQERSGIHSRLRSASLGSFYAVLDDGAPAVAISRASAPSAVGRVGAWFDRVAPTRRLRMEETSRDRVAPSGMHALIVLQAADGSWELTNELASIIGHRLADLRSAMDGASGSRDDVLRAWATALALAWLEQNAADGEDEWRLLAAKARKWIDHTSVVPPGGGTWVDAAGQFLRP